MGLSKNFSQPREKKVCDRHGIGTSAPATKEASVGGGGPLSEAVKREGKRRPQTSSIKKEGGGLQKWNLSERSPGQNRNRKRAFLCRESTVTEKNKQKRKEGRKKDIAGTQAQARSATEEEKRAQAGESSIRASGKCQPYPAAVQKEGGERAGKSNPQKR